MTTAVAAPPRTMVYGELSADRRHIIVMLAGGSPEDGAYAARLLMGLVPHFSPVKRPDGTVEPGVLQAPTSWAVVVQLAATFSASWRTGPTLTDWVRAELLARMDLDGGLTVAPPAGLTPYPWQVSGARLIAATGTAYLNDEAGTGKTVTTVLGLVERAAAGHAVFPALVVCPASVITHWVRTFNDWAPWVRVAPWTGSPDFRRRLMHHHDVYVVSYETCRRDARDDTQARSPLVHLRAETVIIDESHRIKASASKQTLAVQRLARKATNVIPLTGTPIAHSVRDVHTTLEAMDHGAWPSAERMIARYADTRPMDYGDDEVLGLNPGRAAEFWDCLLGQYRRVAKADVLAHLPPKRHTVEYVEMPEPWRSTYDAYEQDMLAELPDGGELDAFTVLDQVRHLTSLASAPGDVETWYTSEVDPETGLEYEKRHQRIILKDDPPGWKVDKLIEVMGRYPGQPIVTAAPSKQLMVLAGARASAAGYRVGYIVGGQTKTQRQTAIDGFQNGDLDLVCATTGAGGVGLTLTAASVLVLLQRPWGLVESSQMEDRLHRIGAEVHEHIDVVDVVAQRTVESRVRQVLKQRAGAFADFASDPRIVAECLGGASVTKIQPRRSA